MKTTITFFIFLCCTIVLQAQSLGPNNGTLSQNVSNGGVKSWSGESNITASDDAYAEIGNIPGGVGSYSEYLLVTGFNFDLPDGVSVFGVQVDIERSDPNLLTSDHSIRLVKGGTLSSGDRSTGAAFPAGDTYASYGGSTDSWGESISYKDVDNNDFGVAIAVERNAASGITAGRIDNIRITVYYSFATLPVTLQSFTASKLKDAVALKWITSEESGIKSYVVERSADARAFTEIKTVESKNTNGSVYNVADERPVPGLSYYRLRILETDGRIKYSGIVSVLMTTANDLKLSPSPWTNGQDLFISNSTNEKVVIRFYNVNGETTGQVSTDSRIVPTSSIGGLKGLQYYRVYDSNNRLVSTGNILVY